MKFFSISSAKLNSRFSLWRSPFRGLARGGALAVLVGLSPTVLHAAPISVAVGNGQATLQLAPDPPMPGKTHATVTLSGASAEDLAKTTATYSTTMPSMSMSGPHGNVIRSAPGRYEFDVMLGMAAPWDVTLHFAGPVSGTAVYHLTVGAKTARSSGTGAMQTAVPSSQSMNSQVSSNAMSSMGGMSGSGDPTAWRNATFALAAILIVAVLIILLRRERRPLAIGLTLVAGIVVVALAIVQSRYATPAMDMASMSSVQGEAPTPVTLAAIHAGNEDPSVFAPGTIAPYLTQDVVTRAGGLLRDFSVYAGDRVRAGQIIATLDAPELQSQAQAAAEDATAQAASAEAARIEAMHHAPNGVVIAHADVAIAARDLAAAQADQTAKAEQMRYWRNELAREKSLLDQGAVSRQEYEDERAQAAVAQAAAASAEQHVAAQRAQVETAQTKASDASASVEQMQAQAVSAAAQAAKSRDTAATEATLSGYTNVASPSNAVVMKRLIDPGVYVPVGTPIARLAVIDRLRVQANVAQRDLAGIAVGTPMEARLQNNAIVRGHVTSVSPIADPTTHTATVEAVVASDGALVPGGYVRVTLHARAATTRGGADVPSAAIVGSSGDAAVWTSVDRAAHRIPVHVVSDDGVTATVTGNLQRAARVVVDGASTLEEGQPISDSRS